MDAQVSGVGGQDLGFGIQDSGFRIQGSGFYFQLKDWRIFSVIGPDAADFLQRISSQNYKSPATGEARDMAILTPTGDIIGFCVGFQPSVNEFYFAVHQREFAATLKQLEDFFFTENLEIKATPDLSPLLLTDHADRTGTACRARTDGILFSRPTLAPGDQWLIAENQCLAELLSDLKQQGFSPLDEAEFEFRRIVAGWPVSGVDYDEDTMILAAGLSSGVAFNKGCYPGQEVVERATAIGASPKKLVTIEFERSPRVPGSIQVEGKEVGRLTSVATLDGRTVGLGQMRTKVAEPQKMVVVDNVQGVIIAIH